MLSGPSEENLVLKIKPRNKLVSNKISTEEQLFFTIMYVFIFSYVFVVLFGEFLLLSHDQKDWCVAAQHGFPGPKKEYANPEYNADPCQYERVPRLLFISRDECDMARRMLLSVLLGAGIGFERKLSERPAGIRTMSLVSLGSCFFTLAGQRAFHSGTMGWDAARVSAAIPSGVGFLGGALIWKGTTGVKGTAGERQEVHGITTAASLWFSAALGVGSGGRLYVVSMYGMALVMIVLRLGPAMLFADDDDVPQQRSSGRPHLLRRQSSMKQKEATISDNNSDSTMNEADDYYKVDEEGAEEKIKLLSLDTMESNRRSSKSHASLPSCGSAGSMTAFDEMMGHTNER